MNGKSIRLTVLAVFFIPVISAAGVSAADEHVWLHVEGRYIKRSPACSKPNEIWMGCGMALWAQMIGNHPDNEKIIGYLKSKGLNHIRIPFKSFLESKMKPGDWPFKRVSYNNARECIDDYLDGVVRACKSKQIYCYLDEHYCMHDSGGEGPYWDLKNISPCFQRWLDDWVGLAEYYRDEPWVLGYELNNEPVNLPDRNIAQNYMECIKNIRKVDKKHILLVGSNNWSHASAMKGTWGPKKFRPDPGYNQVAFVFHEYCNADRIYSDASSGPKVNDQLGYIAEKYNVPFFCTETGADETGGKCSLEEKRRFQQEIIEFCYGEKDFWKDAGASLDWTDNKTGTRYYNDPAYPTTEAPRMYRTAISMWWCRDNYEGAISRAYWTDIWSYAASRMASAPPQPL